MIKDIIQSNETVTPVSREMEGLKEYFPQCFDKEGAFDIERFRDQLNAQHIRTIIEDVIKG